jgi:hypothetical protein
MMITLKVMNLIYNIRQIRAGQCQTFFSSLTSILLGISMVKFFTFDISPSLMMLFFYHEHIRSYHYVLYILLPDENKNGRESIKADNLF